MSEEEIKQWVSDKIEEGHSNKEIKQALEEKNKDPQIVDEVHNQKKEDWQKPSNNTKTLENLNHKKNQSKILQASEKIKGNIQKETKKLQYNNKLLIIPITIILAVTAFTVAPKPDIRPQKTIDNIVKTKPDIEGEFIQVELRKDSASPVRPTIQKEDGIKFKNKAKGAYNVTFDYKVKGFIIKPGETVYRDINNIVYYKAEKVNSEKEINGGVNVR